MDGVINTKHFEHRFQQRGLNQIVIMALLQYGVARKTHDRASSLVFTKAALAEIRSDLGRSVFLACEKLRNAYIVMSEEGTLITVARSYRRTIH